MGWRRGGSARAVSVVEVGRRVVASSVACCRAREGRLSAYTRIAAEIAFPGRLLRLLPLLFWLDRIHYAHSACPAAYVWHMMLTMSDTPRPTHRSDPRLAIRFRPEELQRLKAHASTEHLGVSTWLRRLALLELERDPAKSPK